MTTIPDETRGGTRGLSRRGVWAGVIVFAGVILANAGNYVFQLIAGRYLGPATYGDLAALLAVINLVSLPLGGLQIWVAQHVAEYNARGESEMTHWFVRRTMIYTAGAGLLGTIAFVAVAGPVQNALSIQSRTAVLLATLVVVPAFVTPVIWGLAQGLERFSLIAGMVASAPLLRIVIATSAFAAGYGVAGAMAATLVAGLATLTVPLWFVRSSLTAVDAPAQRISRTKAWSSLLPVILGLLAITALTSIDVLVAKRQFSSHVAGVYGSASLIGRLILYLPTAIVTVLLPRVAARSVARRSSLDLLGWSLIFTIGFSAIATAVYAVAPTLILSITFGHAYSSGERLLWPFGLAMSAFALLNVLLIYHLGKRNYAVAWLVLAGAFAQLAVFASVHTSPRGLIWIDLAVAVSLLVGHEIATRGTAARALRAAITH